MGALTEYDSRILAEALKAAVDGPFFPDWEFQLLFGLDRAEVAGIARSWPDVDMGHPDVDLAFNNAIANLTCYPHGNEREWGNYLSVSSVELTDVLERWRSL